MGREMSFDGYKEPVTTSSCVTGAWIGTFLALKVCDVARVCIDQETAK
jgi:hypothetical protein